MMARNAKPAARPYKLTDGLGLYLLVKPNGSKLWRFRYRFDGQERLLAFGAYVKATAGVVDVPLAEARRRRDEARALLRQGIDPVEHRREQQREADRRRASTFAAVAEEWIAKNLPAWSASHAHRVQKFLRNEIYPAFGDRPIDSINAVDVLAALERTAERGAAEVAKKTRQYVAAVFAYAQRTRGTSNNPALALRGALPRQPQRHYEFVAEADLGRFMLALDAYGNRRTALLLQLQLLTAVRPGEARLARWGEFDLSRGVWQIPAERMKTRQPHTVPLSTAAVATLEELAALAEDGPQPDALLFRGLVSRSKPVTENAMNAAIRRMGFRAVAHGARHAFSTVCNEHGLARPDVIEAALAHKIPGVRGIYNNAQYMRERAELMERWAQFLLDRKREAVAALARSQSRADNVRTPRAAAANAESRAKAA